MFERFTERARQVVVLAQNEARYGKLDRIDTGHVLLGLLGEQESLASRLLTAEGVQTDPVRSYVMDGKPTLAEPLSGQIPFSSACKQALENALHEALVLGHDYIGTEHILLGLVRKEDEEAAVILCDHYGLTPERIRSLVMRALTGPRERTIPQSRQVDITLGESVALWLLELVGCQPVSDPDARGVYALLREALDD